MQTKSIKNLEQWQTKAKQYNPRAGNGWLWATAIALLLMTFIAPVYAVNPCIFETRAEFPSGAYVHGDITIRLFGIARETIVEVIQGGYFGEGRDMCFNLIREQEIFIPMTVNTRTAPLHIICYEANSTAYSGSNGCWAKGQTLETYSLFSNNDDIDNSLEYATMNPYNTVSGTTTTNVVNPTGQNFDVNNSGTIGLTGIPDELDVAVTGSIDSNSNITLGDINVSIENMTIPTDLNVNLTGGVDANLTGGFDLEMTDTNITKSYTNLPADTNNPFILGLAWILFTLGMFLSITFVMQLFKRRE